MKIQILDFGHTGNALSRSCDTLDRLVEHIEVAFKETRFVIPFIQKKWVLQTKRAKYRAEVSFGLVRLNKSKLFCGNHPSACELGNKDDKKSTHLEGADWVEFDDRLNDVLDKLGISADVGATVVIRRGRERCVEYLNGAKPLFGNYQWAKLGIYADYIGQEAPRALFPEGTPGRHEQTNYALVG